MKVRVAACGNYMCAWVEVSALSLKGIRNFDLDIWQGWGLGWVAGFGIFEDKCSITLVAADALLPYRQSATTAPIVPRLAARGAISTSASLQILLLLLFFYYNY